MTQAVDPQKLYDADLTQWLQLSGEYIGRVRPPGERVAWMLFLLDEIRQFVPPADYAAFLRDLQAEIAVRSGGEGMAGGARG